ncbi:hypothetical protein RCH23_001225 [Cryobacterium sp. CAN_C3]|uniref:peptidase M56 family protein n=1 Tax=unclassified Cryobacterium TaxID=2649013 RepID=UPI0018CA2A4F|nr:peptidase M56 family protein [Cryobacterium sp. CAN_C3]MEC5153852.1 hypothetical protein [Cryobacterium sp. CAN_C3]
MNEVEFDPVFSAAVRHELEARASATKKRGPVLRTRIRLGAGIFVGGTLLIGGGAFASGLLPIPGGTQVTELATTVIETHTGSATVDLGPAPNGATNIFVSLTCLTEGTFLFADGASMGCGADDEAGLLGVATYSLLIAPGQDSTKISTSPGARWRIEATWVSERVTDWAVNNNGDTYGAANEKGQPDLVSMVATNNQPGFVYARELAQADGSAQAAKLSSPEEALAWQKERAGKTFSVTVYKSDGKTKVGEFVIQG